MAICENVSFSPFSSITRKVSIFLPIVCPFIFHSQMIGYRIGVRNIIKYGNILLRNISDALIFSSPMIVTITISRSIHQARERMMGDAIFWLKVMPSFVSICRIYLFIVLFFLCKSF